MEKAMTIACMVMDILKQLDQTIGNLHSNAPGHWALLADRGEVQAEEQCVSFHLDHFSEG